MIKKTLYFGNPAYLSLRNGQLVIKLPDVENNDSLPQLIKKESERTIPIEDIGVVVLDNKRITITTGAIEALLDNNSAFISCDDKGMPVGMMLPLVGNTLVVYASAKLLIFQQITTKVQRISLAVLLFMLVQSTKIFSKAQLSGLRTLCFILVVVPLYEVVAEFIVGVKLFH